MAIAGALIGAALIGCAGRPGAREDAAARADDASAPAPPPTESAPSSGEPAAQAVAASPAEEGAAEASETGEEAAEETAVVEVDPALLLGPPVEAAASSDVQDASEGGAGSASGEDAAEVASRRAETAASDRPDGRPSWWLDEPRTESGTVMLSAEALARTVLEARRAAVRVGAASLEEHLGEPARDMEVVAATVRPLRESAGAADMRFAGYVLVRARTDGELAER